MSEAKCDVTMPRSAARTAAFPQRSWFDGGTDVVRQEVKTVNSLATAPLRLSIFVTRAQTQQLNLMRRMRGWLVAAPKMAAFVLVALGGALALRRSAPDTATLGIVLMAAAIPLLLLSYWTLRKLRLQSYPYQVSGRVIIQNVDRSFAEELAAAQPGVEIRYLQL